MGTFFLYLKKHQRIIFYLIYGILIFLVSLLLSLKITVAVYLGVIGTSLLEMCISDANTYMISLVSLFLFGISLILLFPDGNYLFSIIILALCLLFYLVMPNKLGLGDILFLSLLSIIVKIDALIMGLWISCIIALFFIIFFKTMKIPFIPFLTLGFGICLLL